MRDLQVTRPTQVDADAAFPVSGKARNIVTSGDNTGTPWIEDVINDRSFGWQENVLKRAGIVPNGNPEDADDSQIAEAVERVSAVKAQGKNLAGSSRYGCTLTSEEDWVVDNSGSYWKWGGSFPKNVAAGEIPSVGNGFIVVVFGGADLVVDSEGSNVQDYINKNLTPFKNVAEMVAYDYTEIPADSKIEWQGYYAQSDGGGNRGVLKKGDSTSLADDGGSIFIIVNDTVNGVWIESSHLKSEIAIEKFGGKPDDVLVDNAEVANRIYTYATTKLARNGIKITLGNGRYNAQTSVNQLSYCEMEGLGQTVSQWYVLNKVDAFVRPADCRNAKCTKMSITSVFVESDGTTNEHDAIKYDLTGGAEGCFDSNLSINEFRYGIRCGNIWWNNSVHEVRINRCWESIYNDSTDGLSINNSFYKVYSNEPFNRGWRIGAVKNTLATLCNFGGRTDGAASKYLSIFGPNATGITFAACNFENIEITQDSGAIEIWSNSRVNFINGCTFVDNGPNTSGGANRSFEIKSRDTAFVNISNCIQLQPKTGQGFLTATNSSIIKTTDNDISSVTNNLVFNDAEVIKGDERVYKGSSTGVTSGDFIDTGKGSAVSQFFPSLVVADGAYPTVAVATDARNGSGSVRVRFVNIVDGTNNFGTHDLDWLAY